MKPDKLLERILLGRSDANVDFSDLCSLMRALGFVERIKGSHHIYARNDVAEIINLQPLGHFAKPYQAKQVRNIILKYRLRLRDE